MPYAYKGMEVPGFPNMFITAGPNSGLGHTSILLMLESQFEHILRAIQYKDAHAVAAMSPREEVEREFVAEMDRRTQGTVWTGGGCQSWYIDESKRTPVLWPGHTFEFKRRLASFDPGDYLMQPVAKSSSSAQAVAA